MSRNPEDGKADSVRRDHLSPDPWMVIGVPMEFMKR
jgi:hypothetical protein